MIDSLEASGVRGEGVLSGLFNALCSGGQVIGPIMGAALSQQIGFEWTGFWVGMTLFAFIPLLLSKVLLLSIIIIATKKPKWCPEKLNKK